MISRTIVNQLHKCGIGDYIRGCICLNKIKFQFKKKYNFNIDLTFDISHHPISRLLENSKYCNAKNKTPMEAIGFFKSYEALLIPYILNAQPDTTNYVITNATLLDRQFKGEVNLDNVKSIFTPSNEINDIYYSRLEKYSLKPNDYTVLSIRIGDMSINNPWFGDRRNTSNIYDVIEQHILPSLDNKKVVVLSDCWYLKQRLCETYNFLNLETKASSFYLLDSFTSSDTLIDIFLLRDCHKILGLPSGFTTEIARLYNKPISLYNMHVTLNNGRKIKIPIRSYVALDSTPANPKYDIIESDNFYLDN
jgi:hypothetical protein